MSHPENGLRKSKRTSALNWKRGDTRALLRGPGRRAPEEIAANRKKAADERKSKKQAKEAEAKKVVRDIQRASELEDALAKQREEAEDAFPRHHDDIESAGDEAEPDEAEPDETEPDKAEPDETEPNETEPDETEPDETEPDETEPDETEPDETEAEADETELDETEEESPIQKVSKQAAHPSERGPARCQAQVKHGQYDVEVDTPTKPGRGLTGSKTLQRPLKRSHAFVDQEAEGVEKGGRLEEGNTGAPQKASKPKPRAVLKKKDTEEGSDISSKEFEDADLFDLRHRRRVPQRVSPSSEPEQEDVLSITSEEPTPQPKRPAPKRKVDDGISELASADDPGWQMSQGDHDEHEDEDDTTDLGAVENDTSGAEINASDTEESPRPQKRARVPKPRTKKKSKGNKGRGKLRDAIMEGRQRKQPVVEPFQPSVNNRDLQRAKATSDTEAWVRQSKNAAVSQRRQRPMEDTDDEATASATTRKPKKKRRVAVAVAVVDAPSEQSSKAPMSEKVSNKEPTDVRTSSRYGGLENEDDREEYEAIRQSPAKEKGVRISDRAMVKVESPKKIELPRRLSDYKSKHLPHGAFTLWRSRFITTYAMYIGTKHSPWDIKDRGSIEAMQNCWDHVYGSSLIERHEISGIHDVVVVLGDQRWKELRNSIGNAAIHALNEYFNSVKADTNKERHDEAAKLKKKNVWVYGTVKRKPNGNLSVAKPFYGPLILKTFAAFFKWTKTHDETWPMIIGKPPIGALGLATAAVERVIHFWATLKLSPETVDEPAVKPFNKRKSKTGKSENKLDPVGNPSEVEAGNDVANKERFGKIDEFNAMELLVGQPK